ncbi:MAG TPA: hypothetical protein VHA12_00875 [Candidatus Nanoarchaeia archaeon]|nr:hypothetical protein [Candidatus Nanoarchaeia archaeon]
MVEKRGQFFLVAALVISGILIGLAGIYTEVNAPKEDLTVQDVSVELNYESLQVIDQGVYNDLTDEQLFSNIANLTDYYAAKNPSGEFIILYGNKNFVKLRKYSPSSAGTIGINTGGSVTETTVGTVNVNDYSHDGVFDPNLVGQRICVNSTLTGEVYCANSTLGRSFATVISLNKNNETYVSRGSSAQDSLSPQPKTNTLLAQCRGNPPSGNGYLLGPNEYLKLNGDDLRYWTYRTPSISQDLDLIPCTWSCRNDFIVKTDLSGCVPRNTNTHD